jgi:hypothetical protein
MTATLVTLVEIHRIACQKASHKDGKLHPVAAHKGVDMISQQGPGRTIGPGFFEQSNEAIHKHAAVMIVEEYFPSLDPSHYDMLQQPWYIDSGFSRHRGEYSGGYLLSQ